MSEQPVFSFQNILGDWERDPRAASLDYLDLALPRFELHTYNQNREIFCFHRNPETINHKITRRNTEDPLQNLFFDYHLITIHNLSIFFDRFQVYAKATSERLRSLTERVEHLTHLSQAVSEPKEVEAKTLTLLQTLTEKVERLDTKVQFLENNIQI